MPSKQEKYLSTCMLGPLRWSMRKITKSDAKLSEIYEQNEWHLFSRQCNLRFLSTKVLHGSVGTCVNYGRIFIDFFTANVLHSVVVKNFENRLAFRRVTGKNKVAPFFRTRCICIGLWCTPWHVTLPAVPCVEWTTLFTVVIIHEFPRFLASAKNVM